VASAERPGRPAPKAKTGTAIVNQGRDPEALLWVRPVGPWAQRVLPPLQGGSGSGRADLAIRARYGRRHELSLGFEYRYAGHLEDGKASISDPRIGGLL